MDSARLAILTHLNIDNMQFVPGSGRGLLLDDPTVALGSVSRQPGFPLQTWPLAPAGHVSQPWEQLPEPFAPPPTACWGQLWSHLPEESLKPTHLGGHTHSQLPGPCWTLTDTCRFRCQPLRCIHSGGSWSSSWDC